MAVEIETSTPQYLHFALIDASNPEPISRGASSVRHIWNIDPGFSGEKYLSVYEGT